MNKMTDNKKNYFTKVADNHIDCSIGMCSHFDCLNKTKDGCLLVKNKKNNNGSKI